MSAPLPDFEQRVRFVIALASRLHQYGTAAARLETAIDAVSQRLGLVCNIWSNPTGMVVSFADRAEGEDALARVTQVIRLAPGDNDLARLSKVDAIAEAVQRGDYDIAEGYRRLRAAFPPRGRAHEWSIALAHGVAAATVAVLLRTGLNEVLVAGAIGTLIGLLGLYSATRPQLRAGHEAVAGVVAALLVTIAGAHLPLARDPVLIASLIVLLPGLMLTTAVNELANQHLVSGTARLAGAGAVLLKLVFGTAAGVAIGRLAGFEPLPPVRVPLAPWVEWVALLVASLNFAVLFRAARRDVPLTMASAWLGYLVTRVSSPLVSAEFGVFLAGLVVGSLANAYARWVNRPGALVRVPGIILLVPGSVGFRSLFSVFERDVTSGIETAVSLLVLLISLVAGLLFANVLISPRRSLS